MTDMITENRILLRVEERLTGGEWLRWSERTKEEKLAHFGQAYGLTHQQMQSVIYGVQTRESSPHYEHYVQPDGRAYWAGRYWSGPTTNRRRMSIAASKKSFDEACKGLPFYQDIDEGSEILHVEPPPENFIMATWKQRCIVRTKRGGLHLSHCK